MLKLRDVEIGFDKNVLISACSLSVNTGEIIGISGENGSGKSTLLKTIMGFYSSLSGEILFDNTSLLSSKPLFGYLPQIQNRVPDLITRRFLLSVAKRYKTASHIKELTKQFFIENCIDKSLQHLSGGELRKVLLVAVVLQKPKVYLLDEPLQSLDERSSEEISDILSNYLKTNSASCSFITSHNSLFLEEISTTIYKISEKALREEVIKR